MAMASQLAIITRTKTVIRTLNPFKSISTFTFLSHEPQLAENDHQAFPSPLPPNPATGSPIYNENWRNPTINDQSLGQALVPLGFLNQTPVSRLQYLSKNLDAESLMNHFADWMTSQRWSDLKQLFEYWIRSLDKNGKPNMPDVNLYNHYLRANLMIGATAGDMLDLVGQMDEFGIRQNTASFNLVLKSMYQARETEAAVKLLERMLEGGKESLPDDESFELVVGMLFETYQIDAALIYVDTMLKSGHMLSTRVFSLCVKSCAEKGRLDTLASIIEKCKAMDQNKALCPSWAICNYIVDIALRADHSKLAFCALEFMARWIARGEIARPPVLLSVDEGVVVSALGTAGRTFNSILLDASWEILRRSLREKRVPNPESYLGKIYAFASLGNLQKAFSTLHELQTVHENSSTETKDLFSPFTSLYPLVAACSKHGFTTLDSVYYKLETLSRGDPPYKSVAALNCVILGCANIWDLDRAYQTFDAITSFGLSPDIHSYNCLMYAFGRLKQTPEATEVFEHMVGLGVRPNAMTYTLLVDAHLINRDCESAVSIMDEMVASAYVPSKETLKKLRRRCRREMKHECDKKVDSVARSFNIRLGTDNRRELLFDMEYRTGYAA